MDLFSKLKETVQGHIPSKSGASNTPSSSMNDPDIDNLLKSDPTADMSKSSKVLEASAKTDYSGGLNFDSNTPLNGPNQIVRDTPDMSNPLDATSTIPPATDPLMNTPTPPVPTPVTDSLMNNPNNQAYPEVQTAMAQSAYPSSAASTPGQPSPNPVQPMPQNNNMGLPPQPAQQFQQPVQQAPPMQPQQQPQQSMQQQPMSGIPEYPEPPKSVSDIGQPMGSAMGKLDVGIELRGLKNQMNIILEKINMIEERTRKLTY